MAERRREERASVSWPLQAASLSEIGEGTVIDISLCGVQFSMDCRLRQKELILLHIIIDAHTSVDCAAQVVRVQGNLGNWTCAADFRYISAEDRQSLSYALLMAHNPELSRRRNAPAA